MSGTTTKWRYFQGQIDIYFIYIKNVLYAINNCIIYKSLKNTSKNKSHGFFIFGHSWFFDKCPKTKKVSKCFSWHWEKIQEIKTQIWTQNCIGKLKIKIVYFSEIFKKTKKLEKKHFFWNRKHPIISVPKLGNHIINCSINIWH